MAILIGKETKVLVQAITGKSGSLQTKVMLDAGTKIVAGVTPGKGGQEVHGVPVYDYISEAKKEHDFDTVISFVPPAAAKDSCFEAIDAGIRLLVLTTEEIALQDVVDHIEITLCRNFGEEEHPFTYPLNRAERDVLRGEMEACCQLRTGRTLAQHYNHLLVQEEVEPPELTAGTRRIPVDKVSFADELSECGGLLQFYMPVAFAPDAVFGTHVATAENDGWLNVYAAYDLNTGKPCSALDVILVCGDSSEFAFRYPLAKQEQAALLEKMDAYCREQTGMALADFRARYLVEEPQPRQAPSLAQL